MGLGAADGGRQRRRQTSGRRQKLGEPEGGGSSRPPSVWEGRRVRPDQQKTAGARRVARLTARRPAVGHYTSGSEKENLEPVGTLGS